MKLFASAIQTLCDADVEFVVIGGPAANFLGSRGATYDVDFCLSRSRSNLRKLAAALAPLHPRLRDLPALIAAKKAAGRPKDLEALLELESLLEAQEPD